MPAFTPSAAPGTATTAAQFIALIVNGYLDDITQLEALIPNNVATSWLALPDDHIRFGAKYVWTNPGNNERRMVRIHEPDVTAPGADANASQSWIVRIQIGNRHLCVTNPPATYRNLSGRKNEAHIPVKRSVTNLGMLMASTINMHTVTRVNRNKQVGKLDPNLLAMFGG